MKYLRNFFKEPLIQFLIIGALIFTVFGVYSGPEDDSTNSITITSGAVKVLEENFTRSWQRPPTKGELDGLIKNMVRDEIAFREATAMDLDRKDIYIQRRLRMKLESLILDISDSLPPTTEELQDYLKRNRTAFRTDAQIAFSHVYLNTDSRGATLGSDIATLLDTLKSGESAIDIEHYGDSIILPRTYPLTRATEIDKQFGQGFSERLLGLDEGAWLGPIRSSYGLHLVQITKIKPGAEPPLEEIRNLVERALVAEQRQKMLEQTYAGLREKYTVIVETEKGIQ